MIMPSETRGDRHRHEVAATDFDPYAMPIDRTAATYDSASDTFHVIAPLHPEVFDSELSESDQRAVRIRQAAIRIIAGLEARSLREVSKDIGCVHQALDACILRICEKLNLRKYTVSDATRRRQSEARARTLAASRTTATTHTGTGTQP